MKDQSTYFKYHLAFILSIVFVVTPFKSQLLRAQDTRTEYYTESWELTNRDHAAFYRIITYDKQGKPLGKVKDFYLTGELYFEGEMKAVNPDLRQGLCIWYYQNGQRKQEARFDNGEQIDTLRRWSESGKEEGVLDDNGRFFSDNFFDETLFNLSIEFNQRLGVDSYSTRQILDRCSVLKSFLDTERLLSLYYLVHDISVLIEDPEGQSIAYYHISNVYNAKGQYQEAISWLKRSKAILEGLGLEVELSYTYDNLGVNHHLLGQYEEALVYYKQAMEIQKRKSLILGLSTSFNNIGEIYTEQGDYDRALIWHLKSHDIRVASNLKKELSVTYNNLSKVYYSKEKAKEALEWNKKAIDLQIQLHLDAELSTSYNNSGNIYKLQEENKKALKWYKKAIDIQKKLGLDVQLATSLNNLGVFYLSLGKLYDALIVFKESAEIQKKSGLEVNLGSTYSSLAIVYQILEEHETAINYLKEAISIQERLSLENRLIYSYNNLAHFYYEKNQLDSVLLYAQKNININEKLRGLSKGEVDRQLRLDKSLNAVELGILSSYELNKWEKAYALSEQGKSRIFFDLLVEKPIAHSLLSSALNSDYINIKNHFIAITKSLNSNISNVKRKNLVYFRDSLFQRKREMEDQIKLVNPAYAELVYPKTVNKNQIQNVLLPQEALVSFFAGQQNTFAYIITSTQFSMVDLGPSDSLNVLVNRFRLDFLKKQQNSVIRDDKFQINQLKKTFFSISQETYNKLWKPIEATGLLHHKDIIISPDGYLSHLPFELLIKDQQQKEYSEYRYLLKDHSISYSPSGSILCFERANRSPLPNWDKTFLGIGLSKFNNNYCYEDSTIFNQLTYSTSEVIAISDNFKPSTTSTLLEEDATEFNLKSLPLSRYRYLHFSTHGLINTEQPDFSRILLKPDSNDDGCLNIYELFELPLNADLISLSACETGLGKLVNGEGVIGFTRALMYAGTPSMILSLWEVSDESTKDLFTQFYATLAQDGENKYEHLRNAQLEMIKTKKYANPYYWAPFVFIGER